MVYIKWEQPFETLNIVVRNALGQFILEKQFGRLEQLKFELSGNFGSYLLEIQVDQGEKQNFVLIKK